MRTRVLITGATSGIGAALAARFAETSDVLATGSRPPEQATSGLPARVEYQQADQSDPEKSAVDINAALDRIGWTGLDLAVLNAGIGFARDPAAETAQTIQQTMDVNLAAPILLARSLARRLEQAGGTVVFVGSVAHRGSPGFATYAASKAGLHGFARALRQEWKGRIGVQVIHPGPTATPIHVKAGFDPGAIGRFFLRPDTVAALIQQAIRSGRSPVTVSFARFFLSGAFIRSLS